MDRDAVEQSIGKKTQDVPLRKEGYPTVDPGTETLRDSTGICPECHATVVKQRNVCDTYYCGNCLLAYPAATVIDTRG